MSLCVVSRLQAQTLYIYLEIQTLSNTVVHLLINRDGFTSIWGVSHSVCQSSHIISHLSWKWNETLTPTTSNAPKTSPPTLSLKVSSSLLRLAGFFLVLTLVQRSLVVFCTSVTLHRLPCFCRWSPALRLVFFFVQTLQLFSCFWESQLQRSDSFCVRKPFSHRSDNISTSVLRVTVR